LFTDEHELRIMTFLSYRWSLAYIAN